jgi:hypothetical protein
MQPFSARPALLLCLVAACGGPGLDLATAGDALTAPREELHYVRPGDRVKIAVELENPADFEFAFFHFLQRSLFLELNPASGLLEQVVEVPQFWVGPPEHQIQDGFALLTRKVSYIRRDLMGGVDFLVPWLGVPIVTARPTVRNVAPVRLDSHTLQVAFDVEDRTGVWMGPGRVGLRKTHARVTGYFPQRLKSIAFDHELGDPTQDVHCDGSTVAHCTIAVRGLPEQIVGKPMLRLEVANQAGSSTVMSSSEDFVFDWPHRDPTQHDLAEPSVSDFELVGQKGRNVHLRFKYTGLSPFSYGSLSAKISGQEPPGDTIGDDEPFIVTHRFVPTADGHVDLFVEMPAKMWSRTFRYQVAVVAENGQHTERVAVPDSAMSRIRTDEIAIDRDPIRLKGVHYFRATADEVKRAGMK